MFFSSISYGEETITIDKDIFIYELIGNSISYFEDPEEKLTIDQIISSDYNDQFIDYESGVPNFGYTKSAYWFRFTDPTPQFDHLQV